MQLQKALNEAYSDTGAYIERVYCELEVSAAMSISSDEDPDSTELNGECDSEHDPDEAIRMKDDGDLLDGVDLAGDVGME